LTSVSFKWVINRSLPAVSYLTSLDKYAIVCIFYVCLLCVWHAIVGAFWPKPDAQAYDQALLITFSIVFILIHVGLIVWYLNAYRQILQLKKEELTFTKRLENQMMKRKNVELSRV
jgi:predicted signal transduction protein with EAL and GGDEF domain